MDILCFYFSGSGNTWWVLNQLKNELESEQKTVEMYSIENPVLKEDGFVLKKIQEANHVIIGYPIYGSGMPLNMRDFVDELPLVKDSKKISMLCTQAKFSGDGSLYLKGDLERKGYDVRQCFQVNMTSNFHVAKFPYTLLKPDSGTKLQKIKEKALAKIRVYSRMIIRNNEFYDGSTIVHVCDGAFMRLYFKREIKKLVKDFRFFKEKCIKCKLCVKNCPTQNIVMDAPDNDLVRKDNCIMCNRCYNFCPKNAISFGFATSDKDNFIRYKGPEEKPNLAAIKK